MNDLCVHSGLGRPQRRSRRAAPGRAGQQGSLLTDVAIGFALFLVVVVSLVSSVTYALAEWTDAKQRATAVALARSRLEELRAVAWTDLDTGDASAGVGEFTVDWNVIHFPNTWGMGAHMKQVTVRVSYPRHSLSGGQGQVLISTYRSSEQ